MKKTVAFLLCALLCFALVGCSGSGPIDVVKNGCIAEFPDKPIAEAFTDAFEEMGADVEEEWEVVSEGESIEVQCVYTTDFDGEEQTMKVSYLLDPETEEFFIFFIDNNGEMLATSAQINAFLSANIF
ncbi:MAG: hypothetical protein IJC46_07940 [Clostridia bacterium]|nr:hypothetical protein [Clostridia bacterium]